MLSNRHGDRVARRLALSVSALTVAGLTLACGGDGPTAPKKVDSAVRIVAGAGVTDTILSAPVQAVVVEVRDTLGKPVEGTVVRFEAARSTVANRPYETPLYVCTLQQSSCGSTFTYDTTDANGRAMAVVRLGTIAGPTALAIKVPEFGLLDSAMFTVLPGAVTGIGFSVPDTTMSVGAQYTLQGRLLDRYGNAVAGTPTYSSGSSNVTITSAGLVTAVSTGRGTLNATSGSVTAQAHVSVVPVGALVASAYDGVYVVNLDGTGRRRVVARSSSYGAGLVPAWSPDGTKIVFHAPQPSSGQNMVYVADATATDASGTALLDASVSSGSWARYSQDGAYVYFSGRPAGSCCSYSLYRVRTDGTLTEQISPYSDNTIDWRSAPSPDGRKLAYVSNRTGRTTIRIFDIATGTVEGPDVPGQTPRWSPDGSQIAYVDEHGGALHLMQADGTGSHVLTAGSTSYAEAFDWSSDGKWIIANYNYGALVLVSTTTGEALPLTSAGLAGLSQPSWKP
jgi:hypothetical protein